MLTERWLGGMLTNYQTVRLSIQKLKEYERQETDGTFDYLTKKEILIRLKHKRKLEKILSGIREMTTLPQAIFLVDAKAEEIAVKEAKKLNIPVVAMVDTDTDPTSVDLAIPTNDDAMKSVALITRIIANAIIEGRGGSQMLEAMDETTSDSVQTENIPAPSVEADQV
jgi:small subunit ribosomal protein S2